MNDDNLKDEIAPLIDPREDPYIYECAQQMPVGWYQLGPPHPLTDQRAHVFLIGYAQHVATKEVEAALWTPYGIDKAAFLDLTPVPSVAIDKRLKDAFRAWFREHA